MNINWPCNLFLTAIWNYDYKFCYQLFSDKTEPATSAVQKDSENPENQEVENIPGNHAQGMLTILDSMEKGELVNTTENNFGTQEDSVGRCSAPIMPATKQSKLTDFFKK